MNVNSKKPIVMYAEATLRSLVEGLKNGQNSDTMFSVQYPKPYDSKAAAERAVKDVESAGVKEYGHKRFDAFVVPESGKYWVQIQH